MFPISSNLPDSHSPSVIMNTRDRDEILISTVIKLIKRRAIPNLKNVIAKTHSADIAPWFPRLRPEEQIILFDLLIQEGRMGEVLNELNSEERDFFIEATAAPVLVDILHTMPADDVSAIRQVSLKRSRRSYSS